MIREPECYGKMFPSVVEMAHNRSVTGKVLGYELSYQGQVADCRAATGNRDAWQRYLECSDLEGCYRLSAGIYTEILAQ